MQLTSHIRLVASGRLGFALSDDFDCNVYAIDAGDEVTIIDSGAGYRPGLLPALLEREGIRLDRIARILLTHHHPDHSGGAAELTRATGAPIMASATTLSSIRDGEGMNASLATFRSSGSYPHDYVFTPADGTALSPGERFDIGGFELRVLSLPGHCAGHLGFEMTDGARSAVFSGDALLPGGEIVLQPTPDFSPTETFETIRALASMRFDALLPGHLCPALRSGYRHAEVAAAALARGSMPPGVRVPRFSPDPRTEVADYLAAVL